MEEGGIGAIVVFRNSNWLCRMVAERLGRYGLNWTALVFCFCCFYGLDELGDMHFEFRLKLEC